jgi:cytochrome c-type biogenesis protein CcmH/NrfF
VASAAWHHRSQLGLRVLFLLVLVYIFSCTSLAAPQPTVAEIAHELVCDCPDCGKQSVDQCMTHCEVGKKHAAEIAAQLKQGRSKEQILSWFANTYGEQLLGTPRSHGVGWLAIWLPFLALLIGLIPLFLVLRSRRRAKAEMATEVITSSALGDTPVVRDTPDDPRLSEALRKFDF